MSLSRIFLLQILYLVFAVAYNIVSQWRINCGLQALSATDPLVGIINMVIVFAVVMLGVKGLLRTYSVLNALLFLLVLYAGIYLHLRAIWQPELLANYASISAWAIAILINVFGVTIGILGSKHAWEKAGEK